MNSVFLIGRLTKDPELRFTSGGNQTAVCSFTLAVGRYNKDDGADYPRVIVFGKQAENCGNYLKKGRQCAVNGRIQTGSYKNRDGQTVYTTDVVAGRVQFLSSSSKQNETKTETKATESYDDIPAGFEPTQSQFEDLPWNN